MKSGYCPYCGREIAPLAIHPSELSVEWNRCRDWKCKGSRIDVISDRYGFVIHPRSKRGIYIYSRPRGE